MVNLTVSDFVLWIHVIASCIWIGGQIVLGMVVPLLRSDPVALKSVATRFQNAAWIAFAVLVVTGVFNVHEAGIAWSQLNSTPEGRTLSIKLLLVLVSGSAAALHAYWATPRLRTASVRVRAIAVGGLGGLSLAAAMAAALFGVAISQS